MKIVSTPVPHALLPDQTNEYDVYQHQITIKLHPGETIEVEPESFIAGRSVKCKTNVPNDLFTAVTRLFSKVSIFKNTYTSLGKNSWITLASPEAGQIASYNLTSTSNKINLAAGSYLASSSNVKLSAEYDSILNLKGTGITKFQASLPDDQTDGQVLFHSNAGSIIPIEINENTGPLLVDNDHIVAFTEGLNCTYTLPGDDTATIIGSGEGYICEFKGTGTIFVATHPAPSSETLWSRITGGWKR